MDSSCKSTELVTLITFLFSFLSLNFSFFSAFNIFPVIIKYSVRTFLAAVHSPTPSSLLTNCCCTHAPYRCLFDFTNTVLSPPPSHQCVCAVPAAAVALCLSLISCKTSSGRQFIWHELNLDYMNYTRLFFSWGVGRCHCTVLFKTGHSFNS